MIRELYADLTADYCIIFIWVPGHEGFEGNRIADFVANSAHTCEAYCFLLLRF